METYIYSTSFGSHLPSSFKPSDLPTMYKNKVEGIKRYSISEFVDSWNVGMIGTTNHIWAE